MAGLIELKQQRDFFMSKADSILKGAETARRELSADEGREVDGLMLAVKALTPKIDHLSAKNTIFKLMDNGTLLTGDNGITPRRNKQTLTPEYFTGFHNWLRSEGREIGAAMYEGSNTGGGYAVPIVVDDQIVPLATLETGVRAVASVLPTVSDIKFPTKSAFGTATSKAETSAFGGTQPTLGQFTLSAFMGGVQGDLSWELVQDVPAFQQFAVVDMLDAMAMYEENLFWNGTGSGQAQGLLGNVGVGVTAEPDSNGNLVSINATLDVIGSLNALYHSDAVFLMQRATSILIRKAQVGANLFNPAFVSVGGKDYLHGYPVIYSQYAPVAGRGNTSVLFGSFKRGYLIGDRGGSGINVKVLDQPKATQGLITLLAYRRMDGRVRRSEAIQGLTTAAS